MTEEERKALKVGDKIRAMKLDLLVPDRWNIGDVFIVQAIESNVPIIRNGNTPLTEGGNNSYHFEVVKALYEKGDWVRVLTTTGDYGDKLNGVVAKVLDVVNDDEGTSRFNIATKHLKSNVMHLHLRNGMHKVEPAFLPGDKVRWTSKFSSRSEEGVVTKMKKNNEVWYNCNGSKDWDTIDHFTLLERDGVRRDEKGLPRIGPASSIQLPKPKIKEKGWALVLTQKPACTWGHNYDAGQIVTITDLQNDSCYCYSDSKNNGGQAVKREELLLVGDLVYKNRMVGKVDRIYDSDTIDIRWTPDAPRVNRHHIMVDGAVQWKRAPEGVGWGEKVPAGTGLGDDATAARAGNNSIVPGDYVRLLNLNGYTTMPENLIGKGFRITKIDGTGWKIDTEGIDIFVTFDMIERITVDEYMKLSQPECFGNPGCPTECDTCNRKHELGNCRCNEKDCEHGKACYVKANVEKFTSATKILPGNAYGKSAVLRADELCTNIPITEETTMSAQNRFQRARELAEDIIPQMQDKMAQMKVEIEELIEEHDLCMKYPTDQAQKIGLLAAAMGGDEARAKAFMLLKKQGITIALNLEASGDIGAAMPKEETNG